MHVQEVEVVGMHKIKPLECIHELGIARQL